MVCWQVAEHPLLHSVSLTHYLGALMNKFHSLSGILLMLIYGADALIIVCAGVMSFGFIYLAGAHPLLMTVPVGIVIFTGWAFGLSLKRRTEKLVQAVGIAATPLVFAPIWYSLIYKIIESNCAGWSCF